MVSLILQFFVIIFACKDIFSTTQLTKAMFDQYSENDPVEERNPLAKFMVFITVLLILLPIASLGMVLAVFDYAKKTTNDYSTYTLTKENEELMSLFQKIYRDYIMYLVILVYFIIFAHTKGTSKMMMFNIGCAALIIILTGLAGYNIYLAAQFLKVKKSKQQLYQ
jgi:hypothetical protein